MNTQINAQLGQIVARLDARTLSEATRDPKVAQLVKELPAKWTAAAKKSFAYLESIKRVSSFEEGDIKITSKQGEDAKGIYYQLTASIDIHFYNRHIDDMAETVIDHIGNDLHDIIKPQSDDYDASSNVGVLTKDGVSVMQLNNPRNVEVIDEEYFPRTDSTYQHGHFNLVIFIYAADQDRGFKQPKMFAMESVNRMSEGSLGDNASIAKTIIQQMGGKMKAMLGASLMAVENGLKIKWPNKKRSLGNVCIVTLRPDDTYNMEFFNGEKSVKKFEELHAEDLIPTFEDHTGWRLTL